jgi:hypothetical protein
MVGVLTCRECGESRPIERPVDSRLVIAEFCRVHAHPDHFGVELQMGLDAVELEPMDEVEPATGLAAG